MQWWHVAAVANVVIMVACLAIALRIVRGIVREHGSSSDDPLATATTAGVGVWYWIVQGLATAKLSFEVDDVRKGMDAVEQTLVASRKIISDLLGDEAAGTRLGPGDLRRRTAGGPQ